MNYTEVKITFENTDETLREIITAELAECGFDSFVDNGNELLAYIPTDTFAIPMLEVLLPFQSNPKQFSYEVKKVENQNWNAEWEKSYQPVFIGENCVIKSSFHTHVPHKEFEILIDPKMAFGTGHHETTSLIAEILLSLNLTGRDVADIGCGTAILAIIASLKKANNILASDIDDVCVVSSLENIKINNIKNIEVLHGGAEVLINKTFDCIIANINKNVLLADMQTYAASVKKGGTLIISGFYVNDLADLKTEAGKNQLKFSSYQEKNNWCAAIFYKE